MYATVVIRVKFAVSGFKMVNVSKVKAVDTVIHVNQSDKEQISVFLMIIFYGGAMFKTEAILCREIFGQCGAKE